MKHTTGFTVVAIVLCVLANAAPAAAQQKGSGVRPPSVEIGGGIGYVEQPEAGTEDARMTPNRPGENPDPLLFFAASGKARSGPVAVFQIGGNVSPAWGVEGGFQYSNPVISLRITEDIEGVPDVEITTASYRQYAAEGNIVYHLNQYRYDRQKTVPFLMAGAGVLRQQDSDTGVEETGRYYQAGVGFKWFSTIARGGRAQGAGMRLDVRYVFSDGGFDFSDESRRHLITVSATAMVGF